MKDTTVIPSSGTIAAGTAGVSAAGALTSMMSNVPDSAIITIVIAALGVLSTAIKGFVETRKSVNENKFLKARLQELDAENKVYKAHFLPPLPTPTVTTAAAS